MNAEAFCPNGCGQTMMRKSETIVLQYRGYGHRSQSQPHQAWYQCTNCMRTYVSSVFKRFKETNLV